MTEQKDINKKTVASVKAEARTLLNRVRGNMRTINIVSKLCSPETQETLKECFDEYSKCAEALEELING